MFTSSFEINKKIIMIYNFIAFYALNRIIYLFMINLNKKNSCLKGC